MLIGICLSFMDTIFDQPQLYVVVFEIIYFQIYKNIVTKWKFGIGKNDIYTLYEKLENISTSIIEITNNYESSR